MRRIIAVAYKVGPLVAQLVPLAKQAWPIVVAILAILADKSGATDGAATPTTLAMLAAGYAQAAGRIRSFAALGAIAEPLRPLGDVAEVPVFEFEADPKTGRHRAVAVSLHGRKYGLETGPVLYFDTMPTKPGWSAEDQAEWTPSKTADAESENAVLAILNNLRTVLGGLGVRVVEIAADAKDAARFAREAAQARSVEYLDPHDLDRLAIDDDDDDFDLDDDDEDFDDEDVDDLDDDDGDDRTAREQLDDVAGEGLKLRPENLTLTIDTQQEVPLRLRVRDMRTGEIIGKEVDTDLTIADLITAELPIPSAHAAPEDTGEAFAGLEIGGDFPFELRKAGQAAAAERSDV